MAQLNMNLGNATSLDDFSLLPPGEYRALILKSEIKETRSGGTYLSFTYEVTDGEHTGRRVFDKVNLWHSSPKAAEFALRQLKTIATASGHQNPNYIADSSELHGREMFVRLSIRKGDDGAEYQDVKGYRAINAPAGTASGATPPATPPAPPAPAQTTAKKPWE